MVIQTPREADATYAQHRRTVAGTQTIAGNTVVVSIQLYGAPTWADCIPAYLVDKHMGAR